MPVLSLVLALALSARADAPLGRPPCHTPRMLIEGWRAGFAMDYRPASVGYVDSALYPIRVHYAEADDATRAEEVFLPAAEAAWSIEVDEMGWPAPPSDDGAGGSDALDIYMTTEDTEGGAWTWGPHSDVVSDDDYFSVASFIAIDDRERSLPDEYIPTYVVHEFNHVLQYGIDGNELTGFVWESTAEAMEELALPDADLYWVDVPDFQELPFASLLFDGYSSEVEEYDSWSLYEYGGSISGLYLEQAYGSYDGSTLLQLWLNLAQGTATAEPDYVDALGMIGGDEAPTAGDVYLGLAEWRMFAGRYDDGAHYLEGGSWGRQSELETEGELSLATARGSTVSPVDEPYDLGASYWTIAVDDELGEPLRMTVEGDGDVAWGVVAAAWQEEGAARVVRARGEDGEPVEAELDLSGATRIMVGVANLGVADLNAEGRHQRLGFRLSFAAASEGGDSADTADTAPVDSGEPQPAGYHDHYAGGWGCSAAGGRASLGVWGLLALAALRRRQATS